MITSDTRPLLVVEDDGLIRMDLVFMLEDMGYSVIEAANADQALAVLEARPVGAILTDIDMPGSMDGLSLARLAAERWPETAIVIISGRYSPPQERLPDSARFLTKPISEDVLLSTLAGIAFSRPFNCGLLA